ncbi:MAG: hypothetical protein N4A72_22595 [Bacteroidales bacterium]|nr:hypothetical protein [Bacteroidales bacterium]
MRFILTICLLFCTITFSFSQSRVGQWREHFSYNSAIKIIDAGSDIYVLTNGGIFSYNESYSEVAKLGKINGLSGVDVSAIDYDKERKLLFVGHKSGIVDIVNDGRVSVVKDLYSDNSFTEKSINSAFCKDGLLYLSTSFGVAVFDIQKREFRDIYRLYTGASPMNITDCDIVGDNIFAASDNTLLVADLNNSNLNDYKSWKSVNLGVNLTNLKITSYNNKLYVCGLSGATNYLYTYDSGTVNQILTDVDNINEIAAINNGIAVVFDKKVKRVVNSIPSDMYLNDTLNMRNVMYKSDYLYVADAKHSLLKISGTDVNSIKPEGPSLNNLNKTFVHNYKLYFTATTKSNPDYPVADRGMFAEFDSERGGWINRFSNQFEAYTAIGGTDKTKKVLYMGTETKGVVKYVDGAYDRHFTPDNSALQNDKSTGSKCRIDDIEVDENANAWIITSLSANPLTYIDNEGNSQTYDIKSYFSAEKAVKVLLSENTGYLWIIFENSYKAFVIDVNKTPLDLSDDRYRLVSFYDNNGSLMTNWIRDIEEDQDGKLWIGTKKGAVILNNQKSAFDGQLVINIPLVSLSKGAFRLLHDVDVNEIIVDGANRKWVSTHDYGVYLISESGNEYIAHFLKSNSPLPSNDVFDISLHPQTGELFMITDKGTVSYKGDAITGKGSFDNLFVYPNPVRPEYSGVITINGLVEKSLVKVTDSAGKLVFESESLGGRLVWDGKNSNGDYVSSGVYLIFCSANQGQDSKVIKLLVVR